MQVVIGPEADLIADEIRGAIASGAGAAAKAQASAPAVAAAAAATVAATQGATHASAAAPPAGPLDPDPVRWLAVFGGAGNIAALEPVALTRLRVIVRDPAAVDRTRLATLDVAWVGADTFHIVCGEAAARYAQQLSARLGAVLGGA